jgi:hypothetical protein
MESQRVGGDSASLMRSSVTLVRPVILSITKYFFLYAKSLWMLSRFEK